MEHIIVSVVFYLVVVAVAYSGKKQPAATKQQVQPINYFPEVTAEPTRVKQGIKKPTQRKTPELATLTIRELKGLARERKVKNYSRLTKSKLVAELSAA